MGISSKRAEFERIIKEASTNFELFCRVVGKIIPGKHQKEWFRICQEIADNPFSGRGYIIVAPPGSGKSQVVAVLFIAFMIGRYPNEHFGLISYADQPAKDRAVAVRNLIEKSPEYHRIFPRILPDKRSWGVSGFRIKRDNISDFHPTLRAGGATAAIVSYRLSGVIFDDPHDPKNVTNPTQREKVYTNWEQAIKTRLLDGAFRLLITTRWTDDDFAGTLLRKEANSWQMTITQAITPKGRSYWPEHYSINSLREIEHDNPETFAIQYMGDTTQGSSGILQSLTTYSGEIKQEMITLRIQTGAINTYNQTVRYSHPDYGELDLLIACGVDTATKTTEKNDFTVIYTGGVDQNGRLFILDRRKGRWMLPELEEEIISVYEEFRPYSIWVEDASAGTPAVQSLRRRLPSLPLVLETPTIGGKNSRALSIQPFVKNGSILFPKDADWFEDAQYFLLRIGTAKFDDDLDALFMLVNNLLQVKHPSSYTIEGRPKVKMSLR
jgi:predicted phage terminase large subunit-like protein